MNRIYQFFCWTGGGNTEVLKEMPTEQNRFFGYGTVIFMTAVFAMLSSAYAFSLLLQDQIGLFVLVPALAWGFFIFVIDRFFIVTISNRGSFWKKLLIALPRLILAVFIGIIISKPLEFRIFQREISDQLQDIKAKEGEDIDSLFRARVGKLNNDKDLEVSKLSGGQEIAPLKGRIAEWERKLSAKETEITARADSVNCECNGACGTLKRGRGPACKFQETYYNRLIVEKQQLQSDIQNAQGKIDFITAGLLTEINKNISPKYEARADSLEQEKKQRKSALELNYKPSILNQQIALAKIQNDKEKPTAFYTVWFVTILFIFIEMAPMLLKLMTSTGPLENRIAQIEASYSTEDRLRRSLDLEEYKGNRGLVQRLARSQRNIINSALDNWHREQMTRLKDEPEYFNTMFNENHDKDNHK